MSKQLKKIKSPFQCKDCKSFCTSNSRLLQLHRENSCAYVERRRELLGKKYNLNGRNRQPASAPSPTIYNSSIVSTMQVSPIDFAWIEILQVSVSNEMRYMNREDDGNENFYDQPDDCMDSPNFPMSDQHFLPEDNELTITSSLTIKVIVLR